ncbi:MAG: hypothetical protein MI924_18305 [Chloroflexales bacterium]|nr:hypothetical protein [Chloroflexales bacterium]
MRRLHLFEVLDQPWCPASIRDAVTDYLQFSMKLNNPYHVILPRLTTALQTTKTQIIVDLCSGAGGPWTDLRPALEQQLARSLTFVLTDRFPHQTVTESVDSHAADNNVFTVAADARAAPIGPSVFRTIFTGFHHFPPDEARTLLHDAVAQRHGIAIFEATQRRPAAMLLVCLSTLSVLLTTPFIRPWRWSRMFWTYVVPLVPLVVLFDGIVSCLRTYTLDELRELIAQADTARYVWELGEAPIPQTPLAVTFAIGYPQSS